MNRQRRVSILRLLACCLIATGLLWIFLIRPFLEMAPNEASAVASLRTLNTAEITYASTYNSGFTDNLRKFGRLPTGLEQAIFDVFGGIPEDWSRTLSWVSDNHFILYGYRFVLTENMVDGKLVEFQMTAEPQSRGSETQRSFFADQSALLRVNRTGPATARDDPYDPSDSELQAVPKNERLAIHIVQWVANGRRFAVGWSVEDRPRIKGDFRTLRQWAGPRGGPYTEWADLVDSTFYNLRPGAPVNTFTKNGYTFIYKPAGAFPLIKTYTIRADPVIRGYTGRRSFFTDESGIIRANSKTSATSLDPPI